MYSGRGVGGGGGVGGGVGDFGGGGVRVRGGLEVHVHSTRHTVRHTMTEDGGVYLTRCVVCTHGVGGLVGGGGAISLSNLRGTIFL